MKRDSANDCILTIWCSCCKESSESGYETACRMQTDGFFKKMVLLQILSTNKKRENTNQYNVFIDEYSMWGQCLQTTKKKNKIMVNSASSRLHRKSGIPICEQIF